MKNLFLAAFCIVSIIHLYASYKNNTKLRSATKPFIIITLALYYISASYTLNYFLIAFLFFSLLGDVALMINGLFALGGVCFGLGHLCLIVSYSAYFDSSKLSWPVICVAAALYAVILIILFRCLKGHIPKKLFIPMVAYMLTNASMNICGIILVMSHNTLGAVCILIGAILFFISDCILYTVRFHKTQSIFTKHFLVMLTYISAAFLITYGSMVI